MRAWYMISRLIPEEQVLSPRNMTRPVAYVLKRTSPPFKVTSILILRYHNFSLNTSRESWCRVFKGSRWALRVRLQRQKTDRRTLLDSSLPFQFWYSSAPRFWPVEVIPSQVQESRAEPTDTSSPSHSQDTCSRLRADNCSNNSTYLSHSHQPVNYGIIMPHA